MPPSPAEGTDVAADEVPQRNVPLVVDLDGTLLKSDLLFESLAALLNRKPWMVFAIPFWLARGKAHLKQRIASLVELDLGDLPWDERVLALVARERGRRTLMLCTASDEKLAGLVATHFGFFDEVVASDGRRNVSGGVKADVIAARFGTRGFDYVGNARADLFVWDRARFAIVANAGDALARAAAGRCTVDQILPSEGGGLKQWLKALRLHQWLKNVLVFVPMLAAHRFLDPVAILHCVLAFLSFGLCASSVYLLNDLIGLADDRRHPTKSKRPFAAGLLPLSQGLAASPCLALASFGLGYALSPLFAGVLVLYWVLNLSYSLWLRRRVMADVVVLAGLYTLRIVAGAVLLGTAISFWLLAFSMFLFLSLAMLKRYAELFGQRAKGASATFGRGYEVDDLPLLQSLGAASGYLAVLVLALYINSTASELLYRRPQVLWLLCPLLLYWISRAWMIAHRGLMRDDPVIFAATDRTSQITAVLCAAVAAGAI